jgi:excisionase family DNA binding protein
MNAKELAKASGLHYNTIYNMIKNGELKVEKIGKRYKIDDAQAQRLIQAKELCRVENNSYNSSDVIIKVLDEEMHQAHIKYLQAIQETAKLYNALIENVEKKNKSLDDPDVKEKLEMILQTNEAGRVYIFGKKIEELNDLVYKLEEIKYDYEDIENAPREIKKRYEQISNNTNGYKISKPSERSLCIDYIHEDFLEFD